MCTASASSASSAASAQSIIHRAKAVSLTKQHTHTTNIYGDLGVHSYVQFWWSPVYPVCDGEQQYHSPSSPQPVVKEIRDPLQHRKKKRTQGKGGMRMCQQAWQPGGCNEVWWRGAREGRGRGEGEGGRGGKESLSDQILDWNEQNTAET